MKEREIRTTGDYLWNREEREGRKASHYLWNRPLVSRWGNYRLGKRTIAPPTGRT
jgi:hypothetical protein